MSRPKWLQNPPRPRLANRPLVSGHAAATFGSLDPFASAAFEGTDANWLVVRQYDGPPPAAFPWTLFPAPPLLANVGGRLAAVASKSNGAWQATFFSYAADGQVAKRYTYTQANGGGSVLTALNTTSTYVRDQRGALTARADTVGSTTFHHWYEYDTRGLLWKVFAATTDAKPASPDVTYTYRPSGQVESRQFLGEPQPVPLRYTIREQLEQIGDPTGTLYPFSAFYAYHKNGTGAEAQFYNAGSPAAEKRYRYLFLEATSYDALNRLKSADFQGWNGGWTLTAAHDLANIGYDVAGNITALQRYRENGTLVDNLTYSYPGTSNRLSSVSDAVGTTTETWDAETGLFTYDANGNLKTAPAPYGITTVTYDHQNLALSLTSNGATTVYRYNEAGQRITKQVGTGNTEVYLLDGATSLGVVTVDGAGSPASWLFNVLAGDKVVGRQPNVGNRRYYHTDLLGSTRAVVEGVTVVESYDFEPWGLLMPGRTLAGPTKEGFTSKERDGETGLDYFGARYYMPALGRWTSVDPLADSMPQWSAYSYVLDNPVTHTDPFGLCPIWVDGIPCVSPFARSKDLIAANGPPPSGKRGSEWGFTRFSSEGVRNVKHEGLDAAAPIGTEIRAPAGATVTTGTNEKSGLYVHLDLGNGYTISFSHLSDVPDAFKDEQGNIDHSKVARVEAGESVGRVGTTGNADTSGREPHAHIRTREDGRDFNPRSFYSTWTPW